MKEKTYKLMIILIVIGSLLLIELFGQRCWGKEKRGWKGFSWKGFNDPVPQSFTSKPLSDWNYRIIRQIERQRIALEKGEKKNGQRIKVFNNRNNNKGSRRR